MVGIVEAVPLVGILDQTLWHRAYSISLSEQIKPNVDDECDVACHATQTSSFLRKDTTPPGFPFVALDALVENDGGGNAAQLATWLSNRGNIAAGGANDTSGTWEHDAVVFSSISTASAGTQCETPSALVTFSLTDNCDNTATMEANFTIVDTQMPIIHTPPTNLKVDQNDDTNPQELQAWLERHGGAVATDVGHSDVPLVWTHSEPVFQVFDEDSGCMDQLARVTFSVSDACGNTASASATFTIIDSTPANMLTPVQNATYEVQGNATDSEALQQFLDSHGGAVADSEVQWRHETPTVTTQEVCASRVYNITFISTDYCGNENALGEFRTEPHTCPTDRTPSCWDEPNGACLAWMTTTIT